MRLRTGWEAKSRELPPAETPPFDIFLVGSAYSGSTFLGGLLADNLDAHYLGEVAHLPGFVREFGLYDQPMTCLRCLSEGRECPVWTDAVVRKVEEAGPANALAVMRGLLDAPVLVEGSKSPAWLRLAMNGRPSDAPPILVVIAVRSPLAFAVSASGATGAPAWETAQWWRDVYLDALRTANRLGLAVTVIRNEDVRTNPDMVVGGVAHLLGQRPVARPALEVHKHSIGGNLWVHRGYSESTWNLHETLGVPHQVPPPEEIDWTKAATRASTFEIVGPKTEQDAVDLIQSVLDCAGLADLANLLGYEMASEVNRLMAQVSDGPHRGQPLGPGPQHCT